MHYFSPVPMMPLLEIIPHKGTSDAACAAAFEVGKKQVCACVRACVCACVRVCVCRGGVDVCVCVYLDG
jgi:3-hydroxyacyl-CoA dehydrogenase